MRRVVLITTTAIGLVTIVVYGARAADIARQVPPPIPQLIVSPWDGIYIGGNVGWGNTTFTLDTSPVQILHPNNQSGDGIVGGVQVGYNKTWQQFLLGLETDYQVSNIKDTGALVETDLSWFGTTRLRAGYLVMPNWLIYGTGGVAYGQAKITAEGLPSFISLGGSTPGVGWAAGGGIEWALGNGWSIGGEYLRVHLDGPSVNLGIFSASGSANTSADSNIGRGKINFHF